MVQVRWGGVFVVLRFSEFCLPKKGFPFFKMFGKNNELIRMNFY